MLSTTQQEMQRPSTILSLCCWHRDVSSWTSKLRTRKLLMEKRRIEEGYKKEFASLVDTGAWVPVPLEQSRLLRSSVPDRILQPRPVLALRENDDGLHEVEMSTHSARFHEDGRQRVRLSRRTAGPRPLQLIASCRPWGRDLRILACGQRRTAQRSPLRDYAERACQRKGASRSALRGPRRVRSG